MTPQEAYAACLSERKRIPQLELIIAQESMFAYYYAIEMINGRFELGEKTISADAHYSYWYATRAIKAPFSLGHYTIFNSEYKNDYIKFLYSINYDLNKINELII